MKMIFAVLVMTFSFAAFSAAKSTVYCNVGLQGDEYAEMEYHFSSPSEVSAFTIVTSPDGASVKLPSPEAKVENTQFERIVTSVVAHDLAQRITIALPEEMFSESESTFWVLPADADGKDVWGACVSE